MLYYLDEFVVSCDEMEGHRLVILVRPRSPMVACHGTSVRLGQVLLQQLVDGPLNVLVKKRTDPLPERG